jgi:drug/metabolite transporter (DMT)-like permease
MAIPIPTVKTASADAIAALVAGPALGAVGLIFNRASPLGPSATAGWRMLFSLLLTGWKIRSLPPRPLWGWMGLAGLFYAADLALWYGAIMRTSLMSATLIINIYPAIVALLAWPLLGEKPTRRLTMGLVLTLCGGAVVALRPQAAGGSAFTPEDAYVGAILTFCAAFVYAGYTVVTSRVTGELSSTTATFWTNLIALPILFAIAFISGEKIQITGWAALWPVLGLAVFGGVAQLSFAYALQRLPAAFAAMGSHLSLIFTGLVGWAVYSEPITLEHLIGGGLIIGGLVWAREKRKRD